MLDITFITSSIIKLANAKHIAKEYDVNILHYKKKYYGIAYYEPRIPDKNQLLDESMNDAIKRWKKCVSANSTQLFFIEDTSVKIDALSNDKKDVPGTDIKFWIIEQDFKKIDIDLKKRNNNRRACVTSNIVLFLTEDIKNRLKTMKEYKIFSSTTYGNITDKEHHIEINILYPWLDNKSFNKWFVPDTYDVPISMLDIRDADKVDFRKGAFEEMYNFLIDVGKLSSKESKNRFINNKNLLPFFPMFLLCGSTCAGKTTLGRYLLEMYGYYHIEASDFMSLKYYETHGTKFVVDKHKYAEELLKIDPLVIVENVTKYIQKIKNDKVVITGFRTPIEISKFCEIFSNQKLRIILITADFDIRLVRQPIICTSDFQN